MADNESSPKRKKLRLKTTGQSTSSKAGASDASNSPASEGESQAKDTSSQDSGETASLQDPLSVRDTQSVKKLKRLQPEDSPATAKALTESGRLGPPGSDTVRLKVVKDARQSRESGGEGERGETIRLRPAEQQPEGAQTEDKGESTAGDTLRVKPATSGEGESTHTATLRVAKHPQHQGREKTAAAADSSSEQSPMDETQAAKKQAKTGTETLRVKRREKAAQEAAEATAETDEEKAAEPRTTPTSETQAPEKKSKTGTETLRVKNRDKAAQEAPKAAAAPEEEKSSEPGKTSASAQTQAVKPQDQQATSTSTLKVTRPVKPPKTAVDSDQRTQAVRSGDNEAQQAQAAGTGAVGSGETQPAVPASEFKTATAPLKKESKEKAKEKSEDDKDTIRIKPPSQAKTFAKSEKTGGGGAEAAGERAGKGTGKITLKVKKKGADKTLSLGETEEAKDTIQVSEQEAEETAAVPAAGAGRKTLRLKGEAAEEKAGPSAESVGQAVEESAAPEPQAEPGIYMTIAAAASLVGVGVLTFFAVYQYMTLF